MFYKTLIGCMYLKSHVILFLSHYVLQLHIFTKIFLYKEFDPNGILIWNSTDFQDLQTEKRIIGCFISPHGMCTPHYGNKVQYWGNYDTVKDPITKWEQYIPWGKTLQTEMPICIMHHFSELVRFLVTLEFVSGIQSTIQLLLVNLFEFFCFFFQ